MSPRPLSGDLHEITEPDAGARLDKWLAAPERLGSRSKAATAIERGRVFIDEIEQQVRDGGRTLQGGERVRIWIDRPGSAKPSRSDAALGDLRIVHEDEDVFVIEKPAGLLTVPREAATDTDDTVLARLENFLDPSGRRRVFVVHRIDRGTTGLVLVARHGGAARHLSAQFKRREPERCYTAILLGTPSPDDGLWEDRLIEDRRTRRQRVALSQEHGLDAIARYRVEERFPGASLVAVELVTGKRNQIRVQAQARGHPLVGDPIYSNDAARAEIQFPRPALHAARLAFRHPRTGKVVEFESPLPPDMTALLKKLRSATKG